MLFPSLPPVWRQAALSSEGTLTRRRVLQGFGAAAACLPAATACLAQGEEGGLWPAPEALWSAPRWVWLKRAETGQEIRVVYWENGQLIEPAYTQISWFMRDLRFERMLAKKDPAIPKKIVYMPGPWMLMDVVLLDILYAHCVWLQLYGISTPILLNSGVRHLLTNETTEGAAFDSPHMHGGAADIVIPGVANRKVAAFSRWLRAGGVGLYLAKNFTHVDRGRVHSWVR